MSKEFKTQLRVQNVRRFIAVTTIAIWDSAFALDSVR